MPELVVYGRPGCHLCELAIEELEPHCRAAGVALRVVDVDGNERWREAYGLRIPVVCADGQELSGWPLDRPRILGWLRER
jgi:hypothetical protein